MTRSDGIPGEVFLSHATADRRAASALAEELRARGVKVWYSRTHLRAGHDWHRQIGRALRRCDWFVLLLSPASVRSMWVEREVTYALRDRRYRGRIVPMLLKRCRYDQLSWTLDQFQIIDMRRRPGKAIQDLLRRWSPGSQPRRGVRAAPRRKAT